jgi:hypothetical protein
MNGITESAAAEALVMPRMSADGIAQLLTRQAVAPRTGRYLAVLFILLGLVLGGGLYTLMKVQEADERQVQTALRVAQLDREISSRIYQWIAIAQELPPAPGFGQSSAAMTLYGLLLARPEATSGGLQATLPGFANRGLVSLVLELADLLQDPVARRQVAKVGSLIVQADKLFGDCASPRECTGGVAMDILLDRWRR